METIAAPWRQLEGQEVHGRYPLQKCLAEGDRQAVFETLYREKPAIIKLIRPDSSQTAFRLLAGIDTGKSIRHPHLLEIFDSGDLRMDGVRYVYAVMEQADENLGHVLRERTLTADELRELLQGVLSALDFLHSENLIHSGIKPSNILAVGDSLKLSSDGLHAASMPRGFAQAPGIYDAPETGSGTYVPASDVYSLAVLLREAGTGTATESAADQLPSPFDAILRGASIRDPQQRWNTARIRAVLNGEALPPEPAPIPEARPLPAISTRAIEAGDESAVPFYRRFRNLAIAGAVGAGAVVALLIRSTSPAPPAPAKAAPPMATAPVPTPLVEQPAKPSPIEPVPQIHKKTWTVVAATYHRAADAEKRAHALRRHHNSLHPQVVTAGASRFLVVFGRGLSQQQAKSIEQRAKRSGAAPDAFVTQLE